MTNIITQQEITKIAYSKGWKKVLDNGTSFHYETDKTTCKGLSSHIRFSDRDYIFSQSFKDYMANKKLECDLINWKENITLKKLEWIFYCPVIGEDIQMLDDFEIAKYIERQGGISGLEKYFSTWGNAPEII